MYAVTAAALGLVIILALLFARWKLKALDTDKSTPVVTEVLEEQQQPLTQVMHRLCPHHNVVQGFELEEKDSLDEHLDALTRKLADKEGRLRLSKSKIRETQNEIENLHAIDFDVRARYREIMDSLRSDLLNNEKECKKLQEQIEWVSQRRAELKDEVNRGGQMLYGEVAAELANSLAELQRESRVLEQRITDKPRLQYSPTLRSRKEPLPKTVSISYTSGSKHSYNPLYGTTTNTSSHNQYMFAE